MRYHERMNKLSLSAVFLAGLASSASAAGNTITLKGSDTMVILGQRWAEEYMKANKGAVVQVTGGGSGTGIAALINGGTDVAQSSRPMKEEEKKAVQEKRGKAVEEIPVALDGLAIYVHASSPLTEITLAQAKDVYTGKLTDWKQLGGKGGALIAYGRENNSGTYAYFKEHVLGKEDFAAEILSLPGTAAVINAVSKDKNAIGYGGIAYGKGIRALKVKKDDKSAGVEPTMKNVLANTYPISRPLFFYTAGKLEGEAKKFVDFVLSKEGQSVCEAVGYYPLRAKKPAKKGAAH
jgi:phosphate transport system substrate-binding protein